jgi:hypothetical protein
MHLMYLDDAGSVANSQERFFVLAGVALFERQTYHLEVALDAVTARFGHPEPKSLELHGNELQSGRKFWRRFERSVRRQAICDALGCIGGIHGPVRLFGAVIEKAAVSPNDAIEVAFEAVASRFDKFLQRRHRREDPQRGIIILDKSTMETRLQALATEFRFRGHSSGKLNNLADVPFFVDSKASRLVQYADLVAYALWRNFEKDDPEFYDIIKGRFDQEGGVVHGLHVIAQGKD